MTPIEVRNLVVVYRRWFQPPVRAVDGLSFEVHAGEIVGFLGVNGAGKTSTIKTLMGFQPPSAGEVRLFGMPATDARARQLIGFLPETALYSPYLTPYETLRLYGELHGLRGRRLQAQIEALLEAVHLAPKMHTLNKHLSKGMLQRVGIAQALLGEPKLLILDEVSSGLDPIGKRELRELLATQRAHGTTIFFSSHELAEVASICNRILIIHRGKLIAEHRLSELVGRVNSLEDYFIRTVQAGRDILSPCEDTNAPPQVEMPTLSATREVA
ncbi:MAG: ABC transporter ATP-binding protein [Armatimonadota bacterium]|nr:ABC transporter ATP-binding protein [Armatimonadota bacterium]